MYTNNINLHLIGKKYLDTLLYLDSLNLSETNETKHVTKCLGGIYNIRDLDSVCPIYSPVGEKRAVIISEKENSRRTSIVREAKSIKETDSYSLCKNLLLKPDWTHVAYVDDVVLPQSLQPNSVDFCTSKDRGQFLNRLNKCIIAFDSRERKHLYNDLDLDTIIVLHDEHGCEAIFKSLVICKQETSPIKNLHVNGAGDIFAAVFIREYLKSNLTSAVKLSCDITTDILKKRQTNEKV
tara:strand:- start:118 stop:831 length:714 start_codon:yes stop_codon:yes gene_type:complete